MNKTIFSRAFAIGCSILALSLSIGCVSEPKSGRPALASRGQRGGIDELNVLAIPVALDLDGIAGLDGFAIKVYASNQTRPKALPIEAGQIEVFMFDGVPGVTSPPESEPLRVWTYTAREMKQFEIESSIGPYYQMALAWGEAKPSGNRISVLVRYTDPAGNLIRSAPSIISAAMK